MSLLSGQGRAERVREGSIEPGVNGSPVVVTATDEPDPCHGAPGICLVLSCPLNLVLDRKPVTSTGRGARQESVHVPSAKGKGKGLTVPMRRMADGSMSSMEQAEASEAVAAAVVARAVELEERYGSTCLRDVPVNDLNEMAAVLGVSRQRVAEEVKGALVKVRTAGAVRSGALGCGPLVQVRKRVVEP